MIGDEAVGVIAAIVMIWWARELKSKVKELKINNEVLKIYVDNVNGVFGKVRRGLQFKEGKLEFSEEKEAEDEKESDDKVTMKVINDIANSIDGMITMTFDVPSNYEDMKVPMLDLKVRLNENDKGRIYYSFYEKPTKCPFVMSRNSAMPLKKKIEFLSQEAFRRLHNTKKEIEQIYAATQNFRLYGARQV